MSINLILDTDERRYTQLNIDFCLLVQSSSIEPKCFGSGYKPEPAEMGLILMNNR